jgi:glycosyltransferase involved in cell wall biosynthesis
MDHLIVCYFGTYREKYARNQIIIAGLRLHGIEVIECHEKLWESVDDRVGAASGRWMHPKFWWRVVKTYINLLKKFLAVGDFDVLMVGYPGHFDVFPAWLLSRIRKKPLAWDVLNSLYLIIRERGIEERSPITVKLIRQIEKFACMLPDMLFLDTEQFVKWFGKTHEIPTDKFRLIQIGVDDRIFQPLSKENQDDRFRVVYYGTYIPNHGVEYIVRAAKLLEGDTCVQFEMIGSGPDEEEAKQLALQLNLTNIRFTGWIEQEALTQQIAQADLVLGAFGTTKQLELTNNNKIYEGFAMGKPVISGSSPAMPSILLHEKHLYLCERGNPESLANGIQVLKEQPDLRNSLVKNGKEIVVQHFNTDSIGQIAANHLYELVNQNFKVK